FHAALSMMLVHVLARRFTSEGPARLAATVLMLWPPLVTAAGIGQKEQLLIPMLLAIVLLFLPRPRSTLRHTALRWLAGGVLLGFAILIQPSLQLFVFVLIAIAILSQFSLKHFAIAIALTVVGAAVIVAPWTMRNQSIFHSFVLVSTNGGDNFYR